MRPAAVRKSVPSASPVERRRAQPEPAARTRGGSPGTLTVVLAAVIVVSLGALVAWNQELAGRLSAEGHLLEVLQVPLLAAGGVAALGSAIALRRAGRPIVLEVLTAALMGGLVIGEVDLDLRVFGIKVIHTRFFVNPDVAPPLRALAVLVVVGVPMALGLWAFSHRCELWRAGIAALREPWGRVLLAGGLMFGATQVFEKPLARLRVPPPNFVEESVELVVAVTFLIGLVARRLALEDRGRRSSPESSRARTEKIAS